MRYDGALAMDLLCTAVSAGNNSSPQRLPCDVSKVLPPYVTILTECSSQGQRSTKELSNSKKSKKKDRVAGGFSSRRCTALHSLVRLLNASTTSDDALKNSNGSSLTMGLMPSMYEADLTFTSGGVTSNAMFWLGGDQREQHFVQPFKSFSSLPKIGSTSSEHDTETDSHLNGNTPTKRLSDVQVHSILSKLRDVHVELTQKGHARGSGTSGLFLALPHIEELETNLTALQLVWQHHVQPYSQTLLSPGNDIHKL
eukprot:scaffold543815_cov59-Attheya_sp.AAC.1